MTTLISYPEIEYTTENIFFQNKESTAKLLTKSFLQKTYVDLKMSFDDLKRVYGLNYKIFYKSYTHWFTKKERKIIGGGKISISQKTRNSNRCNTGKLRVELDKNLLQEYLDKKFSLEKMAQLCKVAPQTVKANLEFHNLTEQLVKFGLDYERFIAIEAIDNLFGTNILKGLEISNTDLLNPLVENSLKEILNAEIRITQMRATLQRIRLLLMAKFRSRKIPMNSYNLPGSRTNSLVKDVLEEMGFNNFAEFQIENKVYDFKLIDYNILLEIDTDYYHSTEKELANDIFKNELAINNGYTLLRVKLGKSDKRITIKNKIEKCLSCLK